MSEAPERVYMDPDIGFPECEKQYGCDVEYIRADIAKAELDAAVRAALDEGAANVVAFSEMAAQLVEDMSRNPSTTWGQVKAAMRALGDIGDRQALRAAIDAAVRAEREAIASGVEAKIGRHVHPQSLTADILRDLAAAIREGGE